MVDCLASSGTPIIDHYRRCLDTMCGVDTSALNSTLDYISDNCSENGKSGGGKWREKKREKATKKEPCLLLLLFFFFFFITPRPRRVRSLVLTTPHNSFRRAVKYHWY